MTIHTIPIYLITIVYYRQGSPQVVAAAHTPEILSCHDDRWFWITWHQGNIRVGKGDQYDQVTSFKHTHTLL